MKKILKIVICGGGSTYTAGIVYAASDYWIVNYSNPAAIEHSYNKALKAFTINRTIFSMNIAKAILDEMMEAKKDFWPKLY